LNWVLGAGETRQPPQPRLQLASRGGEDEGGGMSASGGGSAGGPGAAEARVAAMDSEVSVGIRTNHSSWLGTCADAAVALNAVVGSLPGCAISSLLLLDEQAPVRPLGPRS
jgi:hypothetical protein